MGLRHLNRPVAFVVVLVVAVVLVGCGGDKGGAKNVEVNSQGLDVNGCKPTDRPKPKTVKLARPTKLLDPSRTHRIVFETNCGNFTVKLYAKQDPKTAASVAYLAEHGVYDGTWFHRIVKHFVVQGGDPAGSGTGDAGYRIKERPHSPYEAGSMAMAKGGDQPVGTSGSQFFIVAGHQGAQLPTDYSLAGKVVSGMDTIQRIGDYGSSETDQSGKPTGVAVIYKATHAASK